MKTHGSFVFSLGGLPRLSVSQIGEQSGIYVNDTADPGQISHVSIWVGPEHAERVKRAVDAFNSSIAAETWGEQ
jgi:hypothetical protein